MDARATTEELSRLADLPEIDDAQLDRLVAALESKDSYTYQEDDGYGSMSSREYEVTVSGSAEVALQKAGPKVLPRLVERFRDARSPVREALLRVMSMATIETWRALTPEARANALDVLHHAVASTHRLFATLQLADSQLTAPDARARDLIALRLLALDAAENDVAMERAIGPVVQALIGPSFEANWAALKVVPDLGSSRSLGTTLVDALLERRVVDPSMVALAIGNAKIRLDAAQRARIAAVLDDRTLGRSALLLLSPYISDATAEAELPLVEKMFPAIARECATSTNEGTWRSWIEQCGHATLARALIPVLRENLASGQASDEVLQHMALVGRALAPIAPELLPYLDPATSPSPRHVYKAVKLAVAIASPITVPALIPLLATKHQYDVLHALAAIGPAAAAAIPAIEQLRYNNDGVLEKLVREAQATALANIRG